jgi:hypothetical protein
MHHGENGISAVQETQWEAPEEGYVPWRESEELQSIPKGSAGAIEALGMYNKAVLTNWLRMLAHRRRS